MRRPGDTPENPQQVAAEELANSLLAVAAPQHRAGNQDEIADVPDAAGRSRAAVEISAQRHMVLAYQSDRAVHYRDPLVHREPELIGRGRAHHRMARPDDLIDGFDTKCGLFPADCARVPERPAALPRAPLV